MRRGIKFLGFVTAATVALALASAASASATTICTNLSSCSSTKYGLDISSSDTLSGSLASTSATLSTSLGSVVCTNSPITAGFDSNGTAPSGEGITALAFNDQPTSAQCNTTFFGNPKATVTVNSLPYSGSVSAVTGQKWNATLQVNNPNVTIKIGTLSCTFSASSVTLNLYNKGNANAPVGGSSAAHSEADAPGVSLTGSGSGCPTSGKWTATYYVTPNNTSGGSDVYVGP
jgi:hypothetical protein